MICGARWLQLEGRVAIVALEPDDLYMSVSHHSAHDLTAALDLTGLVPRPETIVHVDVAHRGVGTLSCGPDVLPGYRVGPGEHGWSWAIASGPTDPVALRRALRAGDPWGTGGG